MINDGKQAGVTKSISGIVTGTILKVPSTKLWLLYVPSTAATRKNTGMMTLEYNQCQQRLYQAHYHQITIPVRAGILISNDNLVYIIASSIAITTKPIGVAAHETSC